MEVTEDVIKEHSQQQEKIHDLSGPGTHQEMGEPVTAADHFEVQPQSACNGSYFLIHAFTRRINKLKILTMLG